MNLVNNIILKQYTEYDCAPVAFFNYFETVGVYGGDYNFLMDLLRTDSNGTDDDTIEAMIDLINTRQAEPFEYKENLTDRFVYAFLCYIDDEEDEHIAFAVRKPGYVRIYNSQLQNDRLDFDLKEVKRLINSNEDAYAYVCK